WTAARTAARAISAGGTQVPEPVSPGNRSRVSAGFRVWPVGTQRRTFTEPNHRFGAPGFTQYELKPAGRGPDARACFGSQHGSAGRIPQGGRALTRLRGSGSPGPLAITTTPSSLMET